MAAMGLHWKSPAVGFAKARSSSLGELSDSIEHQKAAFANDQSHAAIVAVEASDR